MATRVRTEPSERLLNRELSLLDFHARVLELAADESVPLLERVKFAAIFAANVDEFFQVRVAGLLGQAESGFATRSPDGLTPHQALGRIRERVLELIGQQSKTWKKQLRPALAEEGIVVGGIEDMDDRELKKLEKRFHREIYPVLTPLAVGPGQPFPYISGLSLSLAMFVADPETAEERFARVKIPEGLPRFVEIGDRGLYVPMEQVIAHFLPALFPGATIVERAAFRVTRDADFEVFAQAAVDDPNVIAMKTAVYRTSDDSALVGALIQCAEDGKQSVCLVELKARFDERRNIEWSRALERAGVHVVYGFPNLKIHAKMTLLVRREEGDLRRYVHLGTGNYHALTARVYEDFGLFTADEEVAADVADLFNYITGFGRPQRFRKLLVAPFDLRARLIEEIRAVAQAAAAGKTARIRMKVNALTDEAIIDELYLAAQEGAEIDIVARSICSLRPGVPKLSESIRVRSVLGRFLEHSRIFMFQAGKTTSYLLGSADLMPRNLDHRLEVLAPVDDPAVQSRLKATFEVLLSDNALAWELHSDGRWKRQQPKKDEPNRASQLIFMRRARPRTVRGLGHRPAAPHSS